jgi:hypothetical protein
MRSVTLCALTLSAASLFADANLDQRVSLLECKMNKVRGESVFPCRNGARFAMGRPVTTGYNLSAFIDVLYWRFYQGGNDYAVKNTTHAPQYLGYTEKLNFEWEPGYRLGASYGFRDGWDFVASYTSMKSDGDDTEDTPPTGELDPMSPFGITGTYGSAREKLKYSVLNFEMGSSYFLSRSFYLRPHFGLQGAWIHQKMKSNTLGYAVSNRFQNYFNGGGLRAGMDSKWFFHRNWNLVFNASCSALYGKCKVSMREGDATTITAHIGADVSRIYPAAHTLVGLCWEANFAEDNNHLALTMAYETNYWWRQNQLVRLENNLASPPYGTRFSEDLGSQGLTFDFSLYF